MARQALKSSDHPNASKAVAKQAKRKKHKGKPFASLTSAEKDELLQMMAERLGLIDEE